MLSVAFDVDSLPCPVIIDDIRTATLEHIVPLLKYPPQNNFFGVNFIQLLVNLYWFAIFLTIKIRSLCEFKFWTT